MIRRHLVAFREYVRTPTPNPAVGLIESVLPLSVRVNSAGLNEIAPYSEIPIAQLSGRKGAPAQESLGIFFLPSHLCCA